MDQNNPIGLKSIDHLEFCCDTLQTQTTKTFHQLGFLKTQTHETKDQILFEQGQVKFLVNADTNAQSQSRQYFTKHGEGVSKISFQVENVEHAITEAVKRGAREAADIQTYSTPQGLIKTAAICGFGDVINEFVERPSGTFRENFKKLSVPEGQALSQRVSRIDHLTNNVPKGEMDHWVDFYKTIYGFKQTRYFDIKGKKTGLNSKVVQSADNSIIIPINEPEAHGGKSQIQEFLDLHKGSGVQHIALMTPDILSTIAEMREREVKFLKIPHTYYEDISKRELNVTESVSDLEALQLLVDGDKDGYLLQIFSETYIGPLFFEMIQRKNHWGFGEGNFQALFDAIERDQIERGYL